MNINIGINSGWKLLKKINREIPKHLQLHLMTDNYTPHKHPNMKALLEKHKHFQVHFPPTFSSWMNMVERFFRYITVYLCEGTTFASDQKQDPAI